LISAALIPIDRPRILMLVMTLRFSKLQKDRRRELSGMGGVFPKINIKFLPKCTAYEPPQFSPGRLADRV
jgi:hypothetical protein